MVKLYGPENRGFRSLTSVRSFVGSHFPTVELELRPTVGASLKGSGMDSLARNMAAARVKDPARLINDSEPMFGELDYERRVLEGDARAGGLVYDGRALEDAFSRILHPGAVNASIVYTDRLVATYSRDDMRYHLRTVVCGFPSIISIPGIVEAPARPREYYLMRQELELQGAGELRQEKLRSSFKGRFIDYGDPRSTEVLKGLTLQALLYHLTLEPFCDKRDCRFFNAHWQEELIRSQVTSARFCAPHEKRLKELGARPAIAW